MDLIGVLVLTFMIGMWTADLIHDAVKYKGRHVWVPVDMVILLYFIWQLSITLP